MLRVLKNKKRNIVTLPVTAFIGLLTPVNLQAQSIGTIHKETFGQQNSSSQESKKPVDYYLADFDLQCSASPGRPAFKRKDRVTFRSGISQFSIKTRNAQNQSWVIDIRNVDVITANSKAVSQAGDVSYTKLTGRATLANSSVELKGTVYNQSKTLRDCSARIILLSGNLEAAIRGGKFNENRADSTARTIQNSTNEEQRRLAAAREEQRKFELQEQARRAADEKARSEASAKQAAQERVEREREAREEQRRLAAAREEQRKFELREQARRAADEKARSEASAKQAAQERATSRIAANPPLSQRNEDPLARFEGAWVPTSPPGPQIFFNKISLGGRVVSLPLLGQAIIRISNGESGSNFQVSGQGFNCFYMVVFLRANQRMIWDLKAGDPVCMPSNAYELVE